MEPPHNKKEVSGIYIGDYDDVSSVERGIVRHSLYSDKMLILDPFIYPMGLRDKLNPILNPIEHCVQTLKHIDFWFNLFSWIDAGLIEIIRSPAAFFMNLKS